jgi:hypothetical protein
MRWEQIIHDDKMDLASVGYLYAMQAVELGKKSVGEFGNVVVVVPQDLAKKLVFGVVYGFDDVLVVAGEIEEAAALAGRAELGKDVLAGQRYEVVGGIELEVSAKMPEDPWSVVLELEVVLCGRSELVAGAGGLLAT